MNMPAGQCAAGRDGPAAAPPEVVACGPSVHGADTERQERGHVQVLCPSVERVANRPIRLASDCRLRAGAWDCQPRSKQVVMPINGRRVTVDFPAAQNSWSAFQMLQSIGPMAVPLALEAPRQPRDREDRCRLTGEDDDPKVSRMTLACSVWTVEFVKLCADAECRYEPATRRGSDRPRPREGERRPEPPRPAG